MPVAIPFALAAGAGLGLQANQQAHAVTAAKNATRDAQKANIDAIASVKAAQDTASTQAAESIRRKTSNMSQTVFTSPLGLPTSADVARKTLLGQ